MATHRLDEILKTAQSRHGVATSSNTTGGNDLDERKRISRENTEYFCKVENRKEGHLHEADGYVCAECKNKGFISVPVEQPSGFYDLAWRECKCRKIRRTIHALNRSGLADVVHDYTLDKYIVSEPWQQKILDAARAFLASEDERTNWFFFGGQTGAGKTHICTAISVALLKRGKEVKYMLWRDEASRLKGMVNDPAYHDTVSEYKTVDVLYIDDLFKTGKDDQQIKQRPTRADVNLAFEIINARGAANKITIISSECTLTDLIDIDEAVGGRIKQKCGAHCWSIDPDRAKNYRLR